MEQSWDHAAYWEDPASAGPPPAQWHDDRYGCDSWASQHHYDAAAASHGGDTCDSWASERHFDTGAVDDGGASCDSVGREQQLDNSEADADDDADNGPGSEAHRDVAEVADGSDSRSGLASERRSDHSGGYEESGYVSEAYDDGDSSDGLQPELRFDDIEAADGVSGDDSVTSERRCAAGSENADDHRSHSGASDAAGVEQAERSDASSYTADSVGCASTESDDHAVDDIATASIDHGPPAAAGDSMGVRMAAGTDSDSDPEPLFSAEVEWPESGVDSDATTDADEHDSSANARAPQPDNDEATWAALAGATPAVHKPQRLHVEEDLAYALFHRNPGVSSGIA